MHDALHSCHVGLVEDGQDFHCGSCPAAAAVGCQAGGSRVGGKAAGQPRQRDDHWEKTFECHDHNQHHNRRRAQQRHRRRRQEDPSSRHPAILHGEATWGWAILLSRGESVVVLMKVVTIRGSYQRSPQDGRGPVRSHPRALHREKKKAQKENSYYGTGWRQKESTGCRRKPGRNWGHN